MKQLYTITQVYRYLEITKRYKMFFEIVIYCLTQCLKQWPMSSQIFIEYMSWKKGNTFDFLLILCIIHLNC